jgi:hypothetical protein
MILKTRTSLCIRCVLTQTLSPVATALVGARSAP